MRLVLAAGVLLASSGAMAQSFCSLSPFTNCDGCQTTAYARVVVASVQRPAIPGRPPRQPWCGFGFRSGGGAFRAPDILQAPTLGAVRIQSPNLILYRGDRVGRDRLVIRRYWNSAATGREQTATVTYEIEVVPGPM